MTYHNNNTACYNIDSLNDWPGLLPELNKFVCGLPLVSIYIKSFIRSVKVVLHSGTIDKNQVNDMFVSCLADFQCIKTELLPQVATIEKNCNGSNGISTEVPNSYAHCLFKL